MASSPASSDLSEPPSVESDGEDQLSTAGLSSRPSVDLTHGDNPDLLGLPPSKRRKTNGQGAGFDRVFSSLPAAEDDDIITISSDGFSSAPGSPSQNEYALREEAQVYCLWKDCDFGEAKNNDELVKHVQGTHCATGGPKKTKYVCEWGECQRKTSNHPSGYALKAHMRSHTKEKPYYCALPECDKAFTRSDALAKHMRTVHEPELARPANDPVPTGSKKASFKLKLTNGHGTNTLPAGHTHSPSTSSKPDSSGRLPSASGAMPSQEPPPPTHDEDGNPVIPSAYSDNISYTPAHHPITGAPGYMITYPPDVQFSSWESAITADQLLRLLRRQLHWAQIEGEELRAECQQMEEMRRLEWERKEILLEQVMSKELDRAQQEKLLNAAAARVRDAMENDVLPIDTLDWTGGDPPTRNRNARIKGDVEMESIVHTPRDDRDGSSPSPPPTGHSGGGFDGDGDPYDNYLTAKMAEYEERERLKSLNNTPLNARSEPPKVEDDVEA